MATKTELLGKIDLSIVNRIADYDTHPESDDLFSLFADIVYQDDNEAFKALIDAGADVNMQNKYGETLLHISIRRDRREMVVALLDNGADINRTDAPGWTPLMECVMDDMPELCALLIEHGADKSIANKRGATAGMLTQKFGRQSMMGFFR
ncbi:MAG: ankyrin repeat domain-containing protein [Thiovulaceae bacterium]|nr:ankyrin repeat domain-containing protein [Sulfurimonadaceae bacterium]